VADAKRLLLLRHAKSSWDDPALADHDRPLATRGRKAAQLIGTYLRREQIPVSLVLCVMLIGHNPGIQDLTVCLTGDDGEPREQKFPTGALALLTFAGPWRALRAGGAELAAFVKPRELGS
jgi:phosphohistidine phosphatase